MLRKIIIFTVFLLLPLTAGALSIPNPAGQNDGAKAGPDILINQKRLDWRSWEFEAVGLTGTANYLWDFGDKTLGEGRVVKHVFPGSGRYKVTLSASDQNGSVGQTEQVVQVGFWHLSNIYLQIILGVLGLGIIALAVGVAFNLFPKYEEN